MMADDTSERVVALEVEVKHLSKKVDNMDKKVSELHEIMTQAKGAKWALMLLIALGGFVVAKVTPIAGYVASLFIQK